MKPIKMFVNRGLIHAVILGSVLQLSGTSIFAQTPAPAQQVKQDPLLTLVDQAIEVSKVRYLDVRSHTAWQILHGLLALRQDYELQNGHGTVNAIEYISNGAQLKGSYWFEKTPHGGRAHPYNGVMYDFEGHVNQSLAIIAMSNLPLNHKFKVANGQSVTMQDMVNHAKMNVTSKEEITWTLWFLTHYIDQDSEWVNVDGEPWSMEKLVKMQNESSVYNTPCGGSHGLFALAYARNAYLQQHGQLNGEWLRGDQKLQQFISAAQSMQNRDGTFSTKMFKAYGHSYDFDERLKSTGHMTEWLMMALPKKRLEERWIRSAVQSIASDMVRNSTKPAECGGMYHALHALILYKQRMAPQTPTEQPSADLASKPAPNSGPIVSNQSDDSAYPAKVSPKVPVALAEKKPTEKKIAEKTKSETLSPPAPAKPVRVAEVPKELKLIPETAAPTIVPQPVAEPETNPVQEKAAQAESKEVTQTVPELQNIPEGLMPFLKPAIVSEFQNVITEETGLDEETDSIKTQAIVKPQRTPTKK